MFIVSTCHQASLWSFYLYFFFYPFSLLFFFILSSIEECTNWMYETMYVLEFYLAYRERKGWHSGSNDWTKV